MVEQTVVKAIAISHQFTDGDATRQVLDHVDLEIPYGELVTITGPSGSGKTTLLTRSDEDVAVSTTVMGQSAVETVTSAPTP